MIKFANYSFIVLNNKNYQISIIVNGKHIIQEIPRSTRKKFANYGLGDRNILIPYIIEFCKNNNLLILPYLIAYFKYMKTDGFYYWSNNLLNQLLNAMNELYSTHEYVKYHSCIMRKMGDELNRSW